MARSFGLRLSFCRSATGEAKRQKGSKMFSTLRRTRALTRNERCHSTSLLSKLYRGHPPKSVGMTSSQAEKRSQSGVIFDAFDTRNVLSRDVQGVALLRGLHESRKVNNAVLHDDVLGRQMRPPLCLKLCKKPLTNRAIVDARRFSNLGLRQRPQQVAASHDADELAPVDHRYAFDTMPLQELCNFSNRRRRSYCDHGLGHDVRRDPAVCLDVVARESVRIHESIEPPSPVPLTGDFCMAEQIALANDSDNALLPVDHRHATDVPRVHLFRDFPN